MGIHQEEKFVTYHPMGQFNFSDMKVDWTLIAETLSAWIRARIFPSFHLPLFYIGSRKIEILRCRKIEGNFSPGTIVGLNPLVVS
ncbi:MAG: hypothetical protein JZU67_07625, partial [Burkholderiaceae bacterium]|nr:hypothetical protein [Burkholderiaceae bacterium]